MGEQSVDDRIAPDQLLASIRHLIMDIRALERVITDGLLETGVSQPDVTGVTANETALTDHGTS